MSDSDLHDEEFEWTDEPGSRTAIASRDSEASLQPRSLQSDLDRFREETAASPRRLLFLTLAVVLCVAIVVAVVVTSGGEESKQASPTETSSPPTPPSQTQQPPAATPTARPAITVSPKTTLRRGDDGLAVRTLQRALRRLGFAVGVDGVFGPKTEEAVIAFQRAHALSADGVLGAQSARALNSALEKAG
jgi:putative peptidoglycan binding protein